MKPAVLKPLTIALLLALIPLVPALAEDPGVGLSKRAICYTYELMTGNVGLLAGFLISGLGLYTIIKGSMGWGLGLIAAGASFTAIPDLIVNSLWGLQGIIKQSGISSSGNDFATGLKESKIYSGNCEAIPVDMSSYVARAQALAQSAQQQTQYNPVVNPDGTVTLPNGQITTVQQAMDLIAKGGYIGTNQECAALMKALGGVNATSTMRYGQSVMGNNIPIGTPVATYNPQFAAQGTNGYGPPGSPGGASGVSHSGIYMGQDAGGIYLLNQWNGSGGAKISYIPNGSWNGHAGTAAEHYRVVSN